jgi:hypothetical protein
MKITRIVNNKKIVFKVCNSALLKLLVLDIVIRDIDKGRK